jgi:hypothetical protein
MQSMFTYTKAAVARAMKVPELIFRAPREEEITWYQAREISGIWVVS